MSRIIQRNFLIVPNLSIFWQQISEFCLKGAVSSQFHFIQLMGLYDKIYHKSKSEDIDTSTLRTSLRAQDRLPEFTGKDLQKKGKP